MDIDELILRAKNTVFTKESMQEVCESLRRAEQKFEEDRQGREADPQGFLNRQYTM